MVESHSIISSFSYKERSLATCERIQVDHRISKTNQYPRFQFSYEIFSD